MNKAKSGYKIPVVFGCIFGVWISVVQYGDTHSPFWIVLAVACFAGVYVLPYRMKQ
jgi:hypothetical protein